MGPNHQATVIRPQKGFADAPSPGYQGVSTEVVKYLIKQARDVGLDDHRQILTLIDQYSRTGEPDILEFLKHRFARARPKAHVLANPFLNLKIGEHSFDPSGVALGEVELPQKDGRKIQARWPQWLVMLTTLLVGDIGSGKTNAGIVLALRLAERGFSLVIHDLRFDWVGLIRHLPNAVLVTPATDRFNILAGLPGVDIQTLYWDFAETFRECFGLYLASKLFIQKALSKLAQRVAQTGCFPHMGHLRDEVEALEVEPRSPGEAYKERVLDRVSALISAFGPSMLFVQKGFPLEEMVETGHHVIYSCSSYDQSLAAFLTYWRLRRLYLFRTHSDDRRHRPTVWLMDEARLILGRTGLEEKYG